jgi:hypothetical protein
MRAIRFISEPSCGFKLIGVVHAGLTYVAPFIRGFSDGQVGLPPYVGSDTLEKLILLNLTVAPISLLEEIYITHKMYSRYIKEDDGLPKTIYDRIFFIILQKKGPVRKHFLNSFVFEYPLSVLSSAVSYGIGYVLGGQLKK